ncbi:outer membrane protein [Coraliomargarita sp. W4R53]
MKKPILALVPAILACNFASAQENISHEEAGFYGNIFGGYASFSDGAVDVAANPSGGSDFEIDSDFSAGLLLGYDFGMFRLEGEYSHVGGDIEELQLDTGDAAVSSDFESNSFMLNGLFDFEFESFPLTLSIGGGIGASQVEYGEMADILGFVLVDDVDEMVLIYQGIIRGSYAFNEHASLGLSYRYVVTDDFSTSGTVDTGASSSAKTDIDFDSVGISLFEIFFSYNF